MITRTQAEQLKRVAEINGIYRQRAIKTLKEIMNQYEAAVNYRIYLIDNADILTTNK